MNSQFTHHLAMGSSAVPDADFPVASYAREGEAGALDARETRMVVKMACVIGAAGQLVPATTYYHFTIRALLLLDRAGYRSDFLQAFRTADMNMPAHAKVFVLLCDNPAQEHEVVAEYLANRIATEVATQTRLLGGVPVLDGLDGTLYVPTPNPPFAHSMAMDRNYFGEYVNGNVGIHVILGALDEKQPLLCEVGPFAQPGASTIFSNLTRTDSNLFGLVPTLTPLAEGIVAYNDTLESTPFVAPPVLPPGHRAALPTERLVALPLASPETAVTNAVLGAAGRALAAEPNLGLKGVSDMVVDRIDQVTQTQGEVAHAIAQTAPMREVNRRVARADPWPAVARTFKRFVVVAAFRKAFCVLNHYAKYCFFSYCDLCTRPFWLLVDGFVGDGVFSRVAGRLRSIATREEVPFPFVVTSDTQIRRSHHLGGHIRPEIDLTHPTQSACDAVGCDRWGVELWQAAASVWRDYLYDRVRGVYDSGVTAVFDRPPPDTLREMTEMITNATDEQLRATSWSFTPVKGQVHHTFDNPARNLVGVWLSQRRSFPSLQMPILRFGSGARVFWISPSNTRLANLAANFRASFNALMPGVTATNETPEIFYNGPSLLGHMMYQRTYNRLWSITNKMTFWGCRVALAMLILSLVRLWAWYYHRQLSRYIERKVAQYSLIIDRLWNRPVT